MNDVTLRIPFALEKKIYSYSRTLLLRYRKFLKDAIRSNNYVTANLYCQLIENLNPVLECEKAGCHFDLLPWSCVESNK